MGWGRGGGRRRRTGPAVQQGAGRGALSSFPIARWTWSMCEVTVLFFVAAGSVELLIRLERGRTVVRVGVLLAALSGVALVGGPGAGVAEGEISPPCGMTFVRLWGGISQ